MLKIYGIKNCDSVRKAMKYLNEFEIPYTFIDFKTSKVTEEEITYWLKHTDIKTLFNTRSTTYKTLKLNKLNLNDTEKMTYLLKETMLVKRPVIIFDNEVIVGYNRDEYLEKLPKKEG